MKADKNIIKLINEEISDYDFLGNEKHGKLMENIELMENEDFQKQFIIDFLIGKSEKYNIVDGIEIKLIGDWESDEYNDESELSIECNVDLEYIYDPNKEPIEFSLSFDGNNISISNGEINWGDIRVTLYSMEGDEIKFTALEQAPDNIQALFIREFINDVFEEENDMSLPLT
ncbi:MAG: hypothetical protein ACOC2W_02200 [bacterium]